MIDHEQAPLISVIMPVRNESAFIASCLEGFLEQTYPRSRFEIIIANKSEDGTTDVLERYARRHPGWLEVLANPTGRIAEGYNIALAQSHGDIVAAYVGHAVPDRYYLERVARALIEDGVDMVGGKVIPLPAAETAAAGAIAEAMKSPFAVGSNAYTRQARCAVVSTHWMAVARKWILAVGAFDTRLVRGEDCDWYERMIEAGAKSYFYPGIVSYYYPRDTYGKQCRIQVLNAWHRWRLYFLTGRGMRFRHVVPVLAVFFSGFAVLAVFHSTVPVLCAIGLYAAALGAASFKAAQARYGLLAHSAAAIVTIHAGHLVGMFGGLIVYGLPSLMRIFTTQRKRSFIKYVLR